MGKETSGATHLNTFPRAVRLKRRRLIRPLFDREREDVNTLAVGCIRLLYRTVVRERTGYDVPAQVGFAPGRVRSAVTRNRIRRILREVYRVHHHALVDLFLHRRDAVTVMVLFRGRAEAAASCIPRDLPVALEQLVARFTKDGAAVHPSSSRTMGVQGDTAGD